MDLTEKQRLASRGFTLVEVLMVLVLLSMMGGMVVAAIQGVTESAREARTKAIIATVDAVIQEQYESYKYRPLPVEIPDVSTVTPGGSDVGREVLATEAARVRLMMIRDLQRMEMPDRLSDFIGVVGNPSVIVAAANPVREDAGQIVATRHQPAERRVFPVNWFNTTAPSRVAAYRSRVPQYLPSPPAPPSTLFNPIRANELKNQGAECLYMILATSFVGGTPAIDAIPRANIGDTDNDGLLEILDGWGRPLVFIRWPVGYYDPNGLTDTSRPDDFDLFRADYAYFVDPPTATDRRSKPTDVNYVPSNPLPGHMSLRPNTWSIRPLVMSVGPDGEPGIATNPWSSINVEIANFAYNATTWRWPVTTPVSTSDEYYGSEAPGRTTGSPPPHPYPDPYLRKFVADNTSPGGFQGLLPGQQINSAFRADNITNYSLQAAQ